MGAITNVFSERRGFLREVLRMPLGIHFYFLWECLGVNMGAIVPIFWELCLRELLWIALGIHFFASYGNI